jgi:hypothetical protein
MTTTIPTHQAPWRTIDCADVAAHMKAGSDEKPALFSSGNVNISPLVDALIGKQPQFCPTDYLYRHLRGDWGDVDVRTAEVNDDLLKAGHGSLISSYRLDNNLWLEIVTSQKIGGITDLFLSGGP